ncbi:MAG: 2OG-Fe(II) oxygenase [Terricaulis sp.]|nr:2OG-Fe(II) oxygenase [Terricaulis sp.]
MSLALRLSSAIDLSAYAAEYQARGMVQVQGLFTPESAEALSTLLTKHTPWRQTFLDEGKPVSFTEAGIAQVGQAAYRAKMIKVLENGRKAYGYNFFHYPMSQAQHQGWDPGHSIHGVTAFLNGPDFLDLGRAVTGVGAINKVEAMASLYAPGSFLTRHVDHGDGARRAAYVIGLSKEWQPDWGGLLLFYDGKGDVAGGYAPRFNVVTIFDTKHEHAVTQVANFAGASRYSIAGWFRDDRSERVFG